MIHEEEQRKRAEERAARAGRSRGRIGRNKGKGREKKAVEEEGQGKGSKDKSTAPVTQDAASKSTPRQDGGDRGKPRGRGHRGGRGGGGRGNRSQGPARETSMTAESSQPKEQGGVAS